MTKEGPATVDSYIAGFPPDIAHILDSLRKTIRRAAPGATEAIKYGMPVFLLHGSHLFYVGAWKTHVGIYPVYPQAPTLEAEIAPRRSGKDTVRFSYSDPMPYDLVERLVRARVALLKAAPDGHAG